jgi:molybdopterin-binding protein
MSYIVAKVSSIHIFDSLYRVDLDFNSIALFIVGVELHKDIKIGSNVKLAISPSHIAIAKDFSGDISYNNILEATIDSIENGEILSSINLRLFDITLNSIITAKSSKDMNLKEGDKIKALLNATELSIIEVIDD